MKSLAKVKRDFGNVINAPACQYDCICTCTCSYPSNSSTGSSNNSDRHIDVFYNWY